MKITIEYDGTEERVEARHALNSGTYAAIIFDIENALRDTARNGAAITGHEQATESERDACEKVREMIREIILSYGMTLESITE